MKRVILMIMAVLLTSPMYSQSTLDKVVDKTITVIDSGKKTVKEGITYMDTSSNFKTLGNDIRGGVVAMAQALKIGAEHVYSVLVHQQTVWAIVYLIVAVVAIIMIIWCLRSIYWCVTHEPTDGRVAIAIISTVLALIFTVTTMIHLDTIVTGLANPEYSAMQDIVNMAHKIKSGN